MVALQKQPVRCSTTCAALAIWVLLWGPRAAAADIGDGDGPVSFSLPTESDREAWLKPGFRLQLGVGYGGLLGFDGAPSGHAVGPVVRAGLRLDARWSLLVSFQYLYAWSDLVGLRYAGTIEPVWHVTENLRLALGVGFGGFVEGRTERPDPEPEPSTLETSYTFVDASTPLSRCSGVGVTGSLRGEWMWVVGPRLSLGLAMQIDGQWTGCVDDTGRVEPDTAEPIVRRQWWPHLGLGLGLLTTWR